MRVQIQKSGGFKGKIPIPPDKSISHRGAIIGCMASGASVVKNFNTAGDCSATLGCLQSLGANVTQQKEDEIRIEGKDLFGFREPQNILDAQNSGTTARLLLGVLSGQTFSSVLNGDASLRKRPMKRVVEPLRRMGAKIEGRNNADNLPLEIRGMNLKGIEYRLPVPSAQLKSAVILAGLLSEGGTQIEEVIPSRDHTERMLGYMGAEIQIKNRTIRVQGRKKIIGQEIVIPGDFSSACFFIAAALAVEGSEILLPDVGINPTRTGFLDIVRRMGSDVEIHEKRMVCNEPVANLSVNSSDLKGVEIRSDEIPSLIDEIPLIALLATQARGRTEIHGACELRVKESDRIRAVVLNFRKMGMDIQEKPDGFIVEGPQRLKGAHVESFGDHRIAMTLAVAGLAAEGVTEVEGFECHKISFPGFHALLNRWQKNG